MGRPMAICRTSGTVLNSAVIAAGWARAGDALPDLRMQEQQARAAHRGLWAFNASW